MNRGDRKADRQAHVKAFYQPPLSIVVPGGNELPEQQQEQVWQL